MAKLLNNDEATLSLIFDWTAVLQERAGLILNLAPAPQERADAYNGVHLQVPDFNGQQMHLLSKEITRELIYTVTQNEDLSLGTINLEKLLFQRLKRLL